MKINVIIPMLLMLYGSATLSAQSIYIEAESFSKPGGWVTDQQSIDQMGSPYLLAHGLGVPVEDASTLVEVPIKGEYRVWVRTRDWVAPWGAIGSPGIFQLSINEQNLNTNFGSERAEWHWQDGGTTQLNSGENEIRLKDLTGFEGRCDAIFITKDLKFNPPNEKQALSQFRRTQLGFHAPPKVAGDFDLVVVGGGVAGITSALSAARLGCKVALIQNRPVLGGNNSSEVRVGLSGLIFQEPYPNLGKLVDEIGSIGHWTLWEAERKPDSKRSKKILDSIKKNPEKRIHNAGPKSNYGDDKKKKFVESEDNIQLFLNMHVYEVEKLGDKITSVLAKDIETGEELKFNGYLFADCTGDGNLGFLANADYRMGRESNAETAEFSAPDIPDDLVMGTSVQWYAEKIDNITTFPECSWAVKFNEKTVQHLTRGDWDWETGFYWDQVNDIEFIRDYGLRAVYGNWSFLKNSSKEKDKYQNFQLEWVAYIGGKRESRRLLGDIILQEQDLINRVEYPDASFTTTWSIDLHYPIALEDFNEEPFLSKAVHKDIKPYAVPYRTLYSRNIDNLFMAGRNISVTHVALGTVRVMRTTGMMGEVVGMAAFIAKQHKTTPRGVYLNHLDELKSLMIKGVGKNWYE